MILKENIFLIFSLIVFLFYLVITEVEPFVPLIFGLFMAGFIIWKILLGDLLRFRMITIPSFFIFFYIILMSIPSITLFTSESNPVKYTYFIAIQSVLITFPTGVWLANCLTNKPSNIIRHFVNANLIKTKDDFRFYPFYITILVSVLPILILYYVKSEYIQLFEVIKEYPTSFGILEFRLAENRVPEVIFGLYEILRRFALPFCTLYTYFMSEIYGSKWKHILWILFPSVLFIGSLTLDRAPPVSLIITMILAYFLKDNKPIIKKINLKVIVVFTIAIILGGIISVLQYQSEFNSRLVLYNIRYVLQGRIIQNPSYMSWLSFQRWPDSSLFMYGKSIKILAFLFGFDYEAHWPSGFVADLWRNFGWFGVIAGTIIIGFIYQYMQLKLFKVKSIPVLSLYIIVLIGALWIIYGNVLGTVTVFIFISSITILIIRKFKLGSKRLVWRGKSVGNKDY